MRFLARGDAPNCLSLFKHGKDNWSIISQKKKTDEIWQSINEMQQGFCAYCERKLKSNSKSKHLEHFFPRRSNPKLTFSWPNVFGSCSTPNSCGVFKDNNPEAKKIDLNSVCKPDIDNPEGYLVFLSDGKVRPKHGLGASEKKKAFNTIQVFNLDT